MGIVTADIRLANPVLPELKPMTVKCIVDTGSTFLCIPQHLATQLQIKTLEYREATLADGSCRSVPYGGPVIVTFDNRSCFTGALIFGEEVLLGAVPMEDMDLVIIPKLLQLSVNPESPNLARGYVMCV